MTFGDRKLLEIIAGIAGPAIGLVLIYLLPALFTDYEKPEDVLYILRCIATIGVPFLILWSLYKLLEWQRKGKPSKESIQRIRLED